MIKIWVAVIKKCFISGIATTKDVAKKVIFLVIFIFSKVWTITKNVFKYINEKNNKYLIIDLSVEKIIFSKIWTSPRDAFRYINKMEYNKNEHILYALLFAMITFRTFSLEKEDTLSILGLIIVCIIWGLIISRFLPNWLFSVIKWTGGWLKGQGDTKSITRVFSYAIIPLIIGLIIITIFNCLFFLSYLFLIWTCILIIIGISEVQKFSIAKVIFNILLSFLVYFILIIIILFPMWNVLTTEQQSELFEKIFESVVFDLVLVIIVGLLILLINKVVPMKWLKD